jgi:peptide/nickel transport system permease protein
VINYIIRRLLLSIPTVLGVCLFTFLLCNVFASPDAIARKQLGKNPTEGQVKTWITAHGMDKPMFFNLAHGKDGHVHPFDSRFWNHMRELVLFQFPESDYLHEKVGDLLKEKIVPSLTITVPAFLLSILITLPIALFIAYYRGTYLDRMALFVCVILMSIVILNYIIFGQYLLAVVFKYFPIYGYEFGIGAWKFLLLPIILAVASGLGGGVRFYRTVMLNEVRADYVRTAMAKGVGEGTILFKHVLKNAMIPILTTTVLSIPFLITGSLLLEMYFGIPGMGNMLLNAINNHDYPIIRTLVYVYSLLYVAGSILTDISYTLVDPRVTLE